MLNFREITLADKTAFDFVLDQMQPELSDYTFTNFYMWQDTYGLQIAYDEALDYWYILANPPQWKPFFFAPLGDWVDEAKFKAALEKILHYSVDHQMQQLFHRVPEDFVKRVLVLFPQFRTKEDRNTFDYLYNTNDLIELSGRKLHGKRNHLNQFLRSYEWEYQPMDGSVAAECLELDTAWFNLHIPEEDGKISGENRAMIEIFSNFQDLGLTGGVIRIGGAIEALTVGEKLNQGTTVVHIEKANTEYRGIYAAINQQFVIKEWSDTLTINREEDMGLEGLRRAKMAYNPVDLVKKYSIYR